MNYSRWCKATAALVLLGLVSGIQAQERSVNDQFVDNFLLLKLLQSQDKLPALSSKTCDTEKPDPCIIEMLLITAGTRNYCVAVAPNLNVKWDTNGGDFNKKTIRWKLSRPDLDSKDLAFHPDSGIIVTFESDPKKAQVDKKGDYGDGSGSKSPDTYYTKTKRNKPKAESGYLPVILWGSSGKEELCAAIDPKIVNVN